MSAIPKATNKSKVEPFCLVQGLKTLQKDS